MIHLIAALLLSAHAEKAHHLSDLNCLTVARVAASMTKAQFESRIKRHENLEAGQPSSEHTLRLTQLESLIKIWSAALQGDANTVAEFCQATHHPTLNRAQSEDL